MRTGDHVLHKPSGETWVVAFVDGDDLAWCGWPNGLARTSDCELDSARQILIATGGNVAAPRKS